MGSRIALLVGVVIGIVLLLVGCVAALVHPAGERSAYLRLARQSVAWMACYARSIGIVPKLKILFSFYGIATVLNDVYDAKMPPAYTEWVDAAFSWVKIDWVSFHLPGYRLVNLTFPCCRCRRPS